MTFSPELEAKFDKLLKSYPAGRQRSALVPMLMFGQDELGSVTPELIDEIASRIGITRLQVEEVLSYYSMLHTKPLGRRHIQVCTNISCLLRGGDKLWDRVCERTGLKNKEVSADGQISIEEVECIGACSWAPAIQVNYEFHHNVTPEDLDRLIDGFEKKQ